MGLGGTIAVFIAAFSPFKGYEFLESLYLCKCFILIIGLIFAGLSIASIREGRKEKNKIFRR
jgi:hypothetical protein